MNRYQRIVLIGVGVVIAIVQLYGISEYGLNDSRGWAVSFLIAAALLFVGLGSWKGIGNFLSRVAPKHPRNTVAPATSKVASSAKTQPKRETPDKYQYGIHISELDIAIETHKKYAEKTKLVASQKGNGRSLNWNCCASVYASVRYVARKTGMQINRIVWNTIVRAIVVRMSTEESEGIGMGHPAYKELEESAYADVDRINDSVERALAGEGAFEIEPMVKVLASMFGSSGEAIKALSAMVMMNAESAQQKILPELLADLA